MKEPANPQKWNQIGTLQLGELIKLQLYTLWNEKIKTQWKLNHNRKIAEQIAPLMIWGSPGVGKSTIIREITKELNIGFIDVRLAQREPIDIRGLPVPKEDGVHWLVSAEWPRDPESKGIILFDELTAADRTLQVAAYEFILDRRLGDLYTVPENWYIVAAGNRVSDRAVATTISSALANRFMHVELEPDVEIWIKWAMQHNVHPDVIGFIRFRPDHFFNMEGNLERGFPTPRSWERVSTMLHLAEEQKNGSLVDIAIEGLVGTGTGVEFTAYRKWSDKLTSILEIMLNTDNKITIPERADQKYAICSAMVYHLWRGKNEKESARLLDGFFRISLELSSDFAAMAMIDAMHGIEPAKTDDYCKQLLEHELYPSWQNKHGSALKKTITADED
jgi:hypothetical protein